MCFNKLLNNDYFIENRRNNKRGIENRNSKDPPPPPESIVTYLLPDRDVVTVEELVRSLSIERVA